MPKRIVNIDPFELQSSFTCGLTETVASDGSKSYNYYCSQRASTASCTKQFAYALPNGSEIKSATIYANIIKPSFDGTTLINGVSFAATENKTISAEIDISTLDLTGVVEILFSYTCYDGTHNHTPSGTPTTTQQGANTINTYKFTHNSTLEYEKVYLEIEYTCGVYLYHGENNALVPYQLYHAENGELVPYQLFKCVSTEEELSRIAQCMQDEYKQANVDLLNRPQVDWTVMNAAGWDTPEGSYSTVDTVTYMYNDFGLSGDYAINVTPILDDGTVIDGGVDGLWQYISDELNNDNQLEDLDIFLGKYNTVEEAEAAAQRLHELQEDYYALKEETAENILIQY